MTASRASPCTPSRETTLVVILGASKYPRKPEWTNPVLGASARAFRDYVVSSGGLAMPQHVLDLFDATAPAAKQCEAIEGFLRKDELRPARDLVIYYVGHGGFDDQEYYLAVRDTAKDREFLTAIESPKLARIIHESFERRRVYVILDACFAGSAASDWQGSELELAVRRMTKALPARGTAILAAASKDEVARAPRTGTHTMFTGALLQSLRQGIPGGAEKLSLYELYELVRYTLNDENAAGAGRPELHAPQQTEGDVSLLPLFPNAGHRARTLDEVTTPLKLAMPAADEPSTLVKVLPDGPAPAQDEMPEMLLPSLPGPSSPTRASEELTTAPERAAREPRRWRNVKLQPMVSADQAAPRAWWRMAALGSALVVSIGLVCYVSLERLAHRQGETRDAMSPQQTSSSIEDAGKAPQSTDDELGTRAVRSADTVERPVTVERPHEPVRDDVPRSASDRAQDSPTRPRSAKKCQEPREVNPFDTSCDGEACPPCGAEHTSAR